MTATLGALGVGGALDQTGEAADREAPPVELEMLGNRICLLPDGEPSSEKKVNGVYIPEVAQKKPCEGTIVALGDECNPKLAVGDRIAFPMYAFMTLAVEDRTFYIIEGKDALVIIKKAAAPAAA